MRAVRSLVLVHGAGSGPWIFDDWRFDGIETAAVDLQRGVDVSCASMQDYARVVVDATRAAAAPAAVCGWSMGGLVAMAAALEVEPSALVLLEPSASAEVQGTTEVELRDGAFDPEEVYGRFPPSVRARPESQRARDERKAGISIPRVPSRTLVVAGADFADERGAALAATYGCELRLFPELDHFCLVLDPRVRDVVAAYLELR